MNRPRRFAILYLALLVCSHLVIRIAQPFGGPGAGPVAGRQLVDVPRMDAHGPAPGHDLKIAVWRWAPGGDTSGSTPASGERAPVILLHGSPGAASNFVDLAPMLAAEGREVLAIDFPGFGDSTQQAAPDYGMNAMARTTLGAMDALDIERAHLLGFSLGGGVALVAADLAPERIASVTLLASVGVQEAEGSGDYRFERVKYALGYALLVALPEVIPHFGLLGPREIRHSFIRSFWDTDLRPVRALLPRIMAPTLIIHGRRDFLVPAWGAEETHRLIEPSALVMLDASHFLPFLQEREVADLAAPFLARHDDPAAKGLRGSADFAPIDPAAERNIGPFEIVRGAHWWAIVLLIILATFISEDATVITVGVLIAHGEIDAGVGLIGCLIGIILGDGALWGIGRLVGRRALHWPVVRRWLPERALERWGRIFNDHAVKAVFLARAIPGTRLPTYHAAGMLATRARRFLIWAVLAAVLWTPMLLILSALIGPALHDFFSSLIGGPLAIVAAIAVVFVIIRVIEMSTTRLGRWRLAAAVGKWTRSEFWPPWVFYVPLVMYGAWLSLRYRGPLTFTCLNPGVPHGGGVVGESKHQILRELIRGGAGAWIVESDLVADGPAPAVRAQYVDDLVRTNPGFRGYPVALKPDASQRGHAFKVAHDKEEAHRYFEGMTRPALLQAFHPGPDEIGALWARRPEAGLDEPGFVFSITRKVFPKIEGDGVRSLEQLLWTHPRYRFQARTFLKRFADLADWIPAAGEQVSLAVAGNHCQGTMFLDGEDLITPELMSRLNEIAGAFPAKGFDFGRFDLRYADEKTLRRGEGFAIVELNGTMSESTNLYDPRRSLWWRYGVLFRQWRLMYQLGAMRRAAGVRPMRLRELLVAVRDHYKGRPGSEVSD